MVDPHGRRLSSLRRGPPDDPVDETVSLGVAGIDRIAGQQEFAFHRPRDVHHPAVPDRPMREPGTADDGRFLSVRVSGSHQHRDPGARAGPVAIGEGPESNRAGPRMPSPQHSS